MVRSLKALFSKGFYEQAMFIGLFVLISNLPLYLLQLFNYSERPAINIDHLLAASVSLTLLRGKIFLFLVVFFVSISLDIYFYIINMFHFNTEAALNILKDETFMTFENIRNMVLNFLSVKELLILCVSIVAFFYLYVKAVRRFFNSAEYIGFKFLIILLIFLFVANANFRFSEHDKFKQEFAKGMIIQSPIFEYVNSLNYFHNKKPASFVKVDTFGTKEIFDSMDEGRSLNKKIVFVLVESLGVFNNSKIQKSLYERSINNLNSERFYIDVSEVESAHYTVQGEVRELCGMLVNKVYPSGNEEEFADCLPNLLKEKGYRTYSIHNSKQKTFNRHLWYEPLGFESLNFIEQIMLDFPAPDMCRTYIRGICDGFILEKVIPNILSKDEKQFIYWLTLDGHVPLDYYQLSEVEKGECSKLGLEDETLCQYYFIQSNTLSGIANLLNADDRFRDSEVVITGDHTPPFITKELKQQMADGKVPLMIIRSKVFNADKN